MWPRVIVHKNELRANCTPDNVNIGLLDLIPIPHSIHSVSFKNMEGYAAIQHDACADH